MLELIYHVKLHFMQISWQLHVLHSTPWSDVRTQLYSQLKLTPSSHVIDFISKSNGNKFQRKASRAIGKMDVGMITIQAKGNGTTKHVTPHPVSSNKEVTMPKLLLNKLLFLCSVLFISTPIKPYASWLVHRQVGTKIK